MQKKNKRHNIVVKRTITRILAETGGTGRVKGGPEREGSDYENALSQFSGWPRNQVAAQRVREEPFFSFRGGGGAVRTVKAGISGSKLQ